MAAEYLSNEQQAVSLNAPIIFFNSLPCTKGYVYHEDGTGIFILKGIVNCPCERFATYQITFNGNIALPTGATAVVPIAIAISTNGEERPTSRAVFTPLSQNEFGNVTSTAIIQVPKGCCFNISVDVVAPNTIDTPATSVLVENANLVIARLP
jgi:hypothetical protein